jgi:hypothetical protein
MLGGISGRYVCLWDLKNKDFKAPVCELNLGGIMKGELFTLNETKEFLRISAATLRRLLARKLIGYYRVGLRIMFSEQHIADFLDSVERSVRP